MTHDFRIFLALWFTLDSIASPVRATPQQDLILFGQAHLGRSVIDLNLAKGPPYYLRGATGPLTEGRSTPATAFDANNNLVTCAAFVPCIAGGQLWSYEARTNSIRNNTMAGAVVGTPGTMPTYWAASQNGFTGLTISVAATGNNNGMNTVDLSFTGTPSATGDIIISFETGTSISMTQGNTVTLSAYLALVSGSWSNVSSTGLDIQEYNSGGGYLADHFTASSNPSSALSGRTLSVTLGNNLAAHAYPFYQINVTSGQAVTFTLRIAAPELELNSNLPASVASATVVGGGSLYVGASGTMTYNGAGCTTNPVLNVTTSAGAINAVTSVATAGVCTTLPVAGSTTWTPGGGLSVGSGASFTLVPTDNAAQAFATPPILTTNAAVTRNASNLSLATQSCANPSILASGTPSAPTGFPVNQNIAQVDNGTDAQRTVLRRQASTGALLASAIGGTGYSLTPSGTWAQSTLGKLAVASSPGAQSAVFNNGTAATATAATLPTNPTTLHIGVNASGTENFNGGISRVALACGSSLTGY